MRSVKLRMPTSMRPIAVMAGLLASLSSAVASGGIWCNLEDKSIKLSVEAGVTRGMGSPFFNFRGTLEILDPSVAEDLRKLAFSDKNLTQYWLDGKALKLNIYSERDNEKPHGYVDLVIETQTVDEGSYSGSYILDVYDTEGDTSGEGKQAKFSGAIDCGAE